MPRTYPDFRPQATRTASAAGRNLLLATALTTAAVLPLALPVLPAADVGWTYKVVHSNGETIGWPQLVQAVHAVWVSLPLAQRAR